MSVSAKWGVLYGSFLFGAVNYKNLPVLFAQLQEALGLDTAALGDVLGAQGACHVVAVCAFGYAASRVQSRLLLLAGCSACWALGSLLTAAAGDVGALLFGRAIVGLSSGVIGPVSQCLVAEWTPATQRGKIFGRVVALDFTGQALAAVGLAWLVRVAGSWRLALLALAAATLVFSCVGFLAVAAEPARKVKHSTNASWCQQVWQVLRTPSILALILQGFLASTQKEANAFLCLWLQQCGFDATTAASLYSMVTLGNVLGSVAAGPLADEVAIRFPDRGRVLFGQMGDSLRFPALCLLLTVAPAGQAEWTMPCCFSYGLLQSVCYVGAVRPMLTEAVPPELVGIAVAIAATVDGAFASVAAGPLVGWISSHWFGYHADEFSEQNREALQAALGGVLLSGIIGTVSALSLLYWTFPRDRRIAAARASGSLLNAADLEEAIGDAGDAVAAVASVSAHTLLAAASVPLLAAASAAPGDCAEAATPPRRPRRPLPSAEAAVETDLGALPLAPQEQFTPPNPSATPTAARSAALSALVPLTPSVVDVLASPRKTSKPSTPLVKHFDISAGFPEVPPKRLDGTRRKLRMHASDPFALAPSLLERCVLVEPAKA